MVGAGIAWLHEPGTSVAPKWGRFTRRREPCCHGFGSSSCSLAKAETRAQMVDRDKSIQATDFLVEAGPASTHMLNASSPEFTSAFPVALLACYNILEMKDNHAT